VGRSINEFDKAFALREQGNRTKEDVLAVCPEFFVLLPMLRPDALSSVLVSLSFVGFFLCRLDGLDSHQI
jgi:hypothetical protein